MNKVVDSRNLFKQPDESKIRNHRSEEEIAIYVNALVVDRQDQ